MKGLQKSNLLSPVYKYILFAYRAVFIVLKYKKKHSKSFFYFHVLSVYILWFFWSYIRICTKALIFFSFLYIVIFFKKTYAIYIK